MYLYLGILCWMHKRTSVGAFFIGISVLVAEVVIGVVSFGIEGSVEAIYGLLISSAMFSFVFGGLTVIGYWLGRFVVPPLANLRG